MRKPQERGVLKTEHPPADRQYTMPDWHSLWMLLEIHRCGSFRAAAPRVGLSFNALRSRISELETTLGVSLLTRGVTGIRPTPEGAKILAEAQKMEASAYQILRAGDYYSSVIDGEVKIAVTEGLGSAWLVPRIIEFQRRHPRLRIDLSCGMTSADVLRMEADVAVQLTRPQEADLKVVRLGYLHTMPFASNSYANKFGLPTRIEEISDHTLVFQISEETSTLSTYGKTLPALPRAPAIAIKTNASSAHTLAVANGAGIGWLPTYVYPLGMDLIPIDCGLNFRLDVWLTYHPDVDRVPRIRTAIDWLRACFDVRIFPFFGEEYIHPRDLAALSDHNDIFKIFQGFVNDQAE
ncbi:MULTISPECIES: LysR family transcriptional regulator [Methylobacterium]|uniref:LysR family transcriptional regulator n=1 Tax=Methylobacterium TaxID=407 RepID=UPI001FEE12E0|nr:LysR family transcriptional regulator [Methylobacterium sp. DB0501]